MLFLKKMLRRILNHSITTPMIYKRVPLQPEAEAAYSEPTEPRPINRQPQPLLLLMATQTTPLKMVLREMGTAPQPTTLKMATSLLLPTYALTTKYQHVATVLQEGNALLEIIQKPAKNS